MNNIGNICKGASPTIENSKKNKEKRENFSHFFWCYLYTFFAKIVQPIQINK